TQREPERDTRNRGQDPQLVAAARLRDGDNCRRCGIVVKWAGPKSGRYGEYTVTHEAEHNELTVVCRACVARAERLECKGSSLRPVPETPLYGSVTREYLRRVGI